MKSMEKVLIVVPKVDFFRTFGTTIGTFCCVIHHIHSILFYLCTIIMQY